MLLNLKIRDFAIIDAVEFELRPGFAVITGETGAGKSILVDALTLVLGGRSSTDLVRAGAETAEVEALFDISSQPVVRARLEQRELVGDDPETLVVRRVVGPKGRAKVIINGRLSTVASLGEIVRGLVDISGQHEQQSLLHVENHVEILDAYGNHDAIKAAYREAFDEMRRLRRERDALQRGEREALERADYLRFQVEEIRRIDPRDGEEEALEAERQRLAHADRLSRGVSDAENLLYGDDGSAFDKLGKAVAEIEAMARIDPTLGETAGTLESARRDVQEAARELQRYGSVIESDPQRLEEVDDRLAELRRLCRKHGGTVAEVVVRLGELEAELGGIDNADARLAELGTAVAAAEREVWAAAERLSKARARAAKKLDRAVATEVADMDLAGAIFETRLERTGGRSDGAPTGEAVLGPQGLDAVEFLWSANQGEPAKPLARIASGGELSRLMLAVKRVLAARDLVSLYVFDEVDAGIGGRAADRIGAKIQDVSRGHQAIAITHLAPIAARAAHHIRVHKETHGKRTVSVVEVLDERARAEEIARMIDGAHITDATRQAAREMLDRSA
jgi:DNA repair protein RecN (Recombination protein N)